MKSELQIELSKTAVIVVFYKPSPPQIEVFKRLSDSVTVVAVDNSDNRIESKSLGKCIYLPLYKNYGIASAQNKGIEKCKELGVNNVVFFDQDSDVQFSFISDLLLDYIEILNKDSKTAAIGPSIIDKRTNELYKGSKTKRDENKFTRCSLLISTGTLTSLEVINTVGLLEDDLFIDCVDFEWCWRASRCGFHLYRSNNVYLPHEVGKADSSFWGFPIIISTPVRYYYKSRNSLILIKRSYVPFQWKIKTAIRLLFTLVHIMFSKYYQQRRMDYLKNTIKGLKDGIY